MVLHNNIVNNTNAAKQKKVVTLNNNCYAINHYMEGNVKVAEVLLFQKFNRHNTNFSFEN